MISGSSRIATAVPPREAAAFRSRLITRSREPSRASALSPCFPSRAVTRPKDVHSSGIVAPTSYTGIEGRPGGKCAAVAQLAAKDADTATAETRSLNAMRLI
jgi:hypothetical protein